MARWKASCRLLLISNTKVLVNLRTGRGGLLTMVDTTFLDKVRDLYLSRAKQEGYYIINSNEIIEFVQEKIQNIVLEKLRLNNLKK